MEWILNLILAGLLVATLVHAIRLERALGVLKRDRSALEALVAGFNASTQQAESSIHRLRQAADGAGHDLARQADTATALKDDLLFITERGERLADRLEGLVRMGRPMADRDRWSVTPDPVEPAPIRSQAERDLLNALRLAR